MIGLPHRYSLIALATLLFCRGAAQAAEPVRKVAQRNLGKDKLAIQATTRSSISPK